MHTLLRKVGTNCILIEKKIGDYVHDPIYTETDLLLPYSTFEITSNLKHQNAVSIIIGPFSKSRSKKWKVL